MASLKEVFQDQDFVKELATKETPEAAQEAFKAKGVELTIEEVKAIGAKLSGKDKDLSEGELSSVAGGGYIRDIYDDIIYIDDQTGVSDWFATW